MWSRLCCFVVLVTAARATGVPPPPPEVAAYSERLPDSYDIRWPTGAFLPGYGPSDLLPAVPFHDKRLSGAVRRVPQAEFDTIIAPRALQAVRTAHQLTAHRAPPQLWSVDFTLHTSDVSRDWVPVLVRTAPWSELVQLEEARQIIARRRPDVRVPTAHPSPLYNPRPAPPAELSLAAVVTLDEATWARLFQDPAGIIDKPAYRQYTIRDRAGRLLLDGASPQAPARRHPVAAIVRSAPGTYRAHERPPQTWIGDEQTLLHQLVIDDGRGLCAIPGALSLGNRGTVTYSVPVAAPPVAAPATFKAAATTRKMATQLAGHLRLSSYLQRIGELDGEREVPLALAGRRGQRFTDRTTRTEHNQLDEVAQYLLRYYRKLGLTARTQPCSYGGRIYQNVLVDIPGETDEWVLLADHYDTRITLDSDHLPPHAARPASGADDNASAGATLMEAARVLSPHYARRRPVAGIRFLHLVGEEFPSDCLGARAYVRAALAAGERIRAFLLLDMIGWSGQNGVLQNRDFQLNVGEGAAAARLLAAAQLAWRDLSAVPGALQLAPLVRNRFDPRSYLYNTDAVIFSDLGYPALLINEHLNQLENKRRRGYHDSNDTLANICGPYALSLARLAVATTVLMAEDRFSP